MMDLIRGLIWLFTVELKLTLIVCAVIFLIFVFGDKKN